MPQHPFRPAHRWLPRAAGARTWASGVLLVLGATLALTACGGDDERPLPQATTPVAADLTAPQIVTEAQRALSEASSVRIKGQYKQNDKPVTVDVRIAAGKAPADDKATGVVTTDGVRVEIRRLGDQIYLKGDDRFLQALGPKAQTAKGKWLKGPVAQADQGLANLTDLDAFASTLAPGREALTKESVKPLAGQPAISVLSPKGARLWVANTGKPFPLRIDRIGVAVGTLEFLDYNAPVDVRAPSPTVDLATVSQ